jgi:hypothetical protein
MYIAKGGEKPHAFSTRFSSQITVEKGVKNP